MDKINKNKIEEILSGVRTFAVSPEQATNQIVAYLRSAVKYRGMDLLEKSLPSNPEAEKTILGAILLENRLIYSVIGKLLETDFYSSLYRKVYSAMLALTDSKSEFYANGKIDPILIGNVLKKREQLEDVGGIPAITNLTFGLPHFSEVESYVKLVKDSSVIRQTIHNCQLTINECLGDTRNANDILNEHEKRIFKSKTTSNGREAFELSELVQQRSQNFVDVRQGRKSAQGISTGFTDFDAVTGGLFAGLYVIAARPSMGKSSLMRDIARNACKKNKQLVVLIFTFEVSKEQITDALICGEANIDNMLFRGGVLTSNDLIRMDVAMDTLAGYKIIIDDRPNLTVADMTAKALEVRAKYGRIDVIEIDHAHLIKVPKKENKAVELGDVTRDLKILSSDLKCPIILLAQLNRECEKRNPPKPIMSDIRDSGSVEQDADVVSFLYRPFYYTQADKDRGLAEWIVGKNRHGKTPTCRLVFLDHSASFGNRSF